MNKESIVKASIIDNSEFACDLIGKVLESEGVEVFPISYSNSDSVIQSINKEVQLYIVNLIMPQVSGIELIPILRQRIPNCKIIVTSSLDNKKIRKDAVLFGASDFLTRPIDTKMLTKSVAKIVADLENI